MLDNLITPDTFDFSEYERTIHAKANVRSADVYVQGMLDQVETPKTEKPAGLMPWKKTHDKIQFRPGELTVWGGANGGGKSLITGQVALSIASQDMRVCIASFEMKPMKTMERMGRQWTHYAIDDGEILADPVERREMLGRYAEFRDWSKKLIWLYDQQGTVQWRQVCAVARYCAQELRIQHFFIDNLMKCVAGEDDYNGQKAFVDELCSIARDHHMHIHLVHHIKKPAAHDAKPNRYDFKGTGAIVDQCDNVIGVWRNKGKEQSANKTLTDSDTLLIVDKQRHGTGWEGNIALWYLHHSQQFVAGHTSGPMEFFNSPKEQHA